MGRAGADEETVSALEELVHHGLIREGSLDYDFSHHKLREMLYAETSHGGDCCTVEQPS